MKPTEKSLLQYLIQNADDRRLFFSEEKSYTARQVWTCVQALADFLSGTGIRAGDMVALSCIRSMDTAILFFALQAMGVIAVLCDPHTSAGDCLRSTGLDLPVRAFLDYEGDCWTLSAEKNSRNFRIDDLERSGTWLFPPVSVRNTALIVFTSGSTGQCKGVMLSQYNYLNYVVNYRPNGGYSEADVSPEVLPLHHVFGLAVILTGLINRYSVFFPRTTAPDYISECIETWRLTRIDAVPSFTLALAAAAKRHGIDTSSMRVGVLGGAPSSPEQFAFMEEALHVRLLPAYGQSECLVISGAGPEVPGEIRAGSVGRFLSMTKGMILDSEGNPCSSFQEGEICVEAPEVMVGYWGQEEETRKAVDSRGRLHTGDLGFVDDRGFLHITGRIKEIIIRNGNNLSVSGIEQKLCGLPFVAQSAVVGVRDERSGEAPAALIVLREGCAYDAEAEARALVKNERPVLTLLVRAIPLTSSGKADKQRIRALVETLRSKGELPAVISWPEE